MKVLYLLLLVFSLSIVSCLDMITDKCEHVVGRMFLTSANGDNGFRLVYADSAFSCSSGGFCQPIIDDPVLTVLGNDSILFIRAHNNKDTNYYTVFHDHGSPMAEAKQVDRIDFEALQTYRKYFWAVR